MQKLNIVHGAARRPPTLRLVHNVPTVHRARQVPGFAILIQDVLTQLLAGEAYRRGVRNACCAG